jgi:hypothetical protein
MTLNKSNIEEVQLFLRTDEANDIPPKTLRDTLHACLGMLTGAHLKSDEFESLAQTLRESNTQLKEIVSASQMREEELQRALKAVNILSVVVEGNPHEGAADRHEAQMEALRERMTTQREEYERQLAHAKTIESHLRMLAM